jgi:hypothetical protein
MNAKTVSINYEPGEFYMTQGHKGYERRHRNKSGHLVTPTGFGWGSVSKPSRITVGIEVKDKYAEVYVDYFFKRNWGKLTAGRVQAIKDTMPDEIKVNKNKTVSGGTYYTVAEESMDSWLEAAKVAR